MLGALVKQADSKPKLTQVSFLLNPCRVDPELLLRVCVHVP